MSIDRGRSARHRLAVLFTATLAACTHPPPPDSSDVYIWQRTWHPALGAAMTSAADLTHAWRVLAAEASPAGRLLAIPVDAAMLAASARPALPVVRIDGQLQGLDDAALVRDIASLYQRWRSQGLAPTGVEIDHDCGTASLPAYAHFLAALRQALGPDVRLSITALPAWLASPALESVLAEADESVLQVHAVTQPRAGLFDAQQARQWTIAYARRTTRPFRVALPTYGTRVGFDAFGNVADIESERPTLAPSVESRELGVSPTEVAAFLQRLRADPPPHLQGWAWFRLPTAEDQRAWRLATWRAVVEGRSLRAPVDVAWQPTADAGVYDVVLNNAGDVDAELPARVALPAVCAMADAADGYRFVRSADAAAFDAAQPGLLPPRSRLVIGWARCGRPPSSS